MGAEVGPWWTASWTYWVVGTILALYWIWECHRAFRRGYLLALDHVEEDIRRGESIKDSLAKLRQVGQ